MRTSTARLGAAFIAAVALTFGAGAAALADPGNPYTIGGVDQQNATNTGLINPTGDVRLSIHKYLGTATTLPHDGTQQTVTGMPMLAGVEFDVYQVFYDSAHTQPVDLTTNEGWVDASAIYGHTPTAAEIAAGSFVANGVTYYLGTATQVVTDSTGTATFNKVDGQGLYLVAETIESTDTITAYQDKNGDGDTSDAGESWTVSAATITPASPFFVTLPMTEPTQRQTWMYDVNVYPKNQTDTATKEVVDNTTTTTENGNVSDHDVTYTIRTSITDGQTGEQMGMYKVIDQLDARLTYVGTKVYIDPDGDPATENNIELLAGTDYNLVITPEAGTVGTKVEVVFTSAGLTKLAQYNTTGDATAEPPLVANPDAKVVTVISTTIDAQGTTGVIPNMATFIPNQSAYDQNHNGIPTNEVESKYGNVVITKYDPQDATASMLGATFAIFWDTNKDGICQPNEVDTVGDPNATPPTAIKPINTATTVAVPMDPDGTPDSGDEYIAYQATFTGLQTSDWYDGMQQTTHQGYCVVETQAPAGYNLDAKPHYVKILWSTATADDLSTTTINEAAVAYASVDVANEKSNLGNSLPLTGGAGVAAVSLLALILVGGGVAYYVVARRREEQEV